MRRMRRMRLDVIESRRRSATRAVWGANRGLKAPATGGASLRDWLDAARARLAELEAGFTIEKAKVEAMKARLFARLREHFQRRDRLRLVIGYRGKYLKSHVGQGEAKEIQELTGESALGTG